MSYVVYTQKIDTPIQTYVSTAKRKIIENQETPVIDNEEKFRGARGIIFALILCIPFWILLIKYVVW